MQLLRKRIPVTRLDLGDLIVGQFGKIFFAATFQQNTRVLSQEAKQWYDLWRGPMADSVRGIGTFKPRASISAAYPTGVARSGSLEP